MFRPKRNTHDVRRDRSLRDAAIRSLALEPLEGRQFLSASPFDFHPHFGHDYGGPGSGDHAQPAATITYDQAPAAVQTGLETLATTAGLTDPTSTQSVTLHNVDGVETYSLTINGTGTSTTLTVDASGNAVTAPTHSTTTWSTLNGTANGSNSAAATEISAIASALDLTAPGDDTTVNVNTDSAGNTTYSVLLNPSTTTSSSSTMTDFTTTPTHSVLVSVDSNGNPVGNQTLPFNVLPTTIQDGINANLPSGTTALSTDSTQSVHVQTVDGTTLYSTSFTSTGTSTTVTVNSDGDLASAPSRSTTTFSTLTSAVQTELQTLATAKGVTDTISSDQSVDTLTEANGTTLYTLTLPATTTSDDGTSSTHDVTLTVDSDGNPTTLPTSRVSFADDQYHGPRHDFGFDRPSFWSSTPIPENFLG